MMNRWQLANLSNDRIQQMHLEAARDQIARAACADVPPRPQRQRIRALLLAFRWRRPARGTTTPATSLANAPGT